MYFQHKKKFMIQQEGFNNLWKRKMFCKDEALLTSLRFKEINDNDEIDIMMDGITSEECDGYKCYNFDDVNSEGNLKNNL